MVNHSFNQCDIDYVLGADRHVAQLMFLTFPVSSLQCFSDKVSCCLKLDTVPKGGSWIFPNCKLSTGATTRQKSVAESTSMTIGLTKDAAAVSAFAADAVVISSEGFVDATRTGIMQAVTATLTRPTLT